MIVCMGRAKVGSKNEYQHLPLSHFTIAFVYCRVLGGVYYIPKLPVLSGNLQFFIIIMLPKQTAMFLHGYIAINFVYFAYRITQYGPNSCESLIV